MDKIAEIRANASFQAYLATTSALREARVAFGKMPVESEEETLAHELIALLHQAVHKADELEQAVHTAIKERTEGNGMRAENAVQTNELSRHTLFPSTRALLEAGISCRQSENSKGWAIYWMEGGAELTLFPGDEGPQEASSIEEIIDWIGGDQPCYLTPASLKRFGVQAKK